MAIAIFKRDRSYIKDVPYLDDTILNDLIAEYGKIYISYIDDETGKIIGETWYMG
jgi:hypothetical protein